MQITKIYEFNHLTYPQIAEELQKIYGKRFVTDHLLKFYIICDNLIDNAYQKKKRTCLINGLKCYRYSTQAIERYLTTDYLHAYVEEINEETGEVITVKKRVNCVQFVLQFLAERGILEHHISKGYQKGTFKTSNWIHLKSEWHITEDISSKNLEKFNHQLAKYRMKVEQEVNNQQLIRHSQLQVNISLEEYNNLTMEDQMELERFINFWYVDHRSQLGRFYSSFTNLKSTLRPFIYFNHQPLESIDIACSQPLLLGKLLQDQYPNDLSVQTYVKDCSEGTLYNNLMVKNKTRKDAKLFFFSHIAFGQNKKQKRLLEQFEVLYPNLLAKIHQLHSLIQSTKGHHLAIEMSITEGKIMNEVWDRMEYFNLKPIGLHDATFTSPENISRAKVITLKIWKKYLTFTPTLK